MLITDSKSGQAFHVVPVDSRDAKVSRGRSVVTDRAGTKWNTGTPVGYGHHNTQPVAWRYDYENAGMNNDRVTLV